MAKQLRHRDMLAWAAGFIDGEGSVVLGAQHPTPAEREKRGGNNYRHAGQMKLVLAAWQTQREPLLRLQFLFGGRIYGNPPRSERHAASFQWRLQDQHALEALVAMEPFLVNKRPHVQIARDFRALVTGTTWGPPGMPPGEIAKRRALKEAIAILNARGPKTEENDA